MGSVSCKWKLTGLRQALKQPGVCAELGRRAARIASELNAQAPGYGSSVAIHRATAVGRVYTSSQEACENEARRHSMEPYCDRSYKGGL